MRMEIEMVQMLHRQLQLSINEMEDSMDSLLRARSQLDASWTGGSKDSFFVSLNTCRSQMGGIILQLTTLSQYLGAEIEQWIQMDERGADKISQIVITAPSSFVTAGLIAAAMSIEQLWQNINAIPGLDPEVWKTLSIQEKMDVANQIHQQISDYYGVPAIQIYKKDLNDGILADLYIYRPKRGFYQPDELPYISIDEALFRDPEMMCSTLIHETRHSVQDYAVRHPEINYPGISAETREQWAINMQDYQTPEEDGFPAYFNQPIEVDARTFSEEALRQF